MQLLWHSYDRKQAIDLSKYLSGIRWTGSVVPPWDTATIVLRMLDTQALETILFGAYAPRLGDWVSLLDDNRRLVYWGRAAQFTSDESVNPDGAVLAATWTITTESWFSALERQRILPAPASVKWATEGANRYIVDTQAWGNFVVGLMGAFKFDTPGELLQNIWSAIAGSAIPESLGFFSQPKDFSIVYDDITAESWAPDRQDQMLRVEGNAIAALQGARPGASFLSMVRGAFSADPRMVEMFPSIETNTNTQTQEPVLIYRLRPLQVLPLSRPEDQPGFTEAESIGLFQTPIRSPEPGENGDDYYFTTRDIYAKQGFTWSEDNRINTVTTRGWGSTNSPLSVGTTSKPVIETLDVAQNGVRLLEVDWPFFPRFAEAAQESTLFEKYSAISELAYAMNAGTDYVQGSMTVAFRPRIKAGHWFTAELAPGVWMTAYIQGVSHSLQVGGNGERVGRTMLNFVRGDVDNVPWNPAQQEIKQPEGPLVAPRSTFP